MTQDGTGTTPVDTRALARVRLYFAQADELLANIKEELVLHPENQLAAIRAQRAKDTLELETIEWFREKQLEYSPLARLFRAFVHSRTASHMLHVPVAEFMPHQRVLNAVVQNLEQLLRTAISE